MKEIKMDTLTIDKYSEKYRMVKEKFIGDSNSPFITNISDRLENSKNLKEFSFQSAYIVLFNSDPIGYVYVSNDFKDEVYVEFSILKEYRKLGLGKKLLDEFSDFLFCNYNIRNINLDISPSNKKSMQTALSCGYLLDEEEFESRNYTGRMVFFKQNPFYISKRKK